MWGRASTSLVGSSPREVAEPVVAEGPLVRGLVLHLCLFLQGVVAEVVAEPVVAEGAGWCLRLLHLFLQGAGWLVPGLVLQGVVAGVVTPPGFLCQW